MPTPSAARPRSVERLSKLKSPVAQGLVPEVRLMIPESSAWCTATNTMHAARMNAIAVRYDWLLPFSTMKSCAIAATAVRRTNASQPGVLGPSSAMPATPAEIATAPRIQTYARAGSDIGWRAGAASSAGGAFPSAAAAALTSISFGFVCGNGGPVGPPLSLCSRLGATSMTYSLQSVSLQSVSLQSVSDQSVSLQSVSLQSVSDQSVSLQSVSLQSVSLQSVSLQSVIELTALSHEAASKYGWPEFGSSVTNLVRLACGLGALLSPAAPAAFSSPTPPEYFAAEGSAEADFMSAP